MRISRGRERRRWLLAAAAAALLGAGAGAGDDVPEPAARLHRSALVFDAHVHMINRQLHLGGDIGDRVQDGHVDLPRLGEGGLDALFCSLFVSEEYYPSRYETRQALRLVELALDQIDRNAETIGIALRASDIDRLNRQGRIAAVLDLEGGFDLDGDLGVLRALYRLGLRAFQLPAHNWANNFADSCCATQKWRGLNERGRAIVREANRLGMMINVSHGSDETVAQAIEISTDPVVATHHGLRSLNDIPRTMPDALLRKLAAKGGVMGIHIGNEFHNRRLFDHRSSRAGRPFWDTSSIGRREAALSIFEIDRLLAPRFPMVGIEAPDELKLDVDGWIEVVERAIAVAGEDHIALGSDFDGGPTLPRGLRDARDYPRLTAAMLRRGWPEARIRKFLGENLRRVFLEVTER